MLHSFALSVAVWCWGGIPGTVDLHAHVTMAYSGKPFFKGLPDESSVARSVKSSLVNQLSSAGFKQAHISVVLASVWPPFALRPGRTEFAETMRQLQRLKGFAHTHPQFRMVSTPAELRRAVQLGQIALVPAVEGAEGITRVDEVDALWNAGARSVTLFHLADSALGGAAADQNVKNLLGIQTNALNREGLTPLGRQVVERMLELGMVIDLAHASDASAREVLAMAEAKSIPVINSHTGVREISGSERNASAEIITRIGKNRGMVGIPVFGELLSKVPTQFRWNKFEPETCDDLLAHWVFARSLVGPTIVTLGSDFNGFIVRPSAGGSCPNGLRSVAEVPQLWNGLMQHGFSSDELNSTAQTFLTLWEEVLEKKTTEPVSSRLPPPQRFFEAASF